MALSDMISGQCIIGHHLHLNVGINERKVSCTVVSDSLRFCAFSLSRSPVHGILQARVLEWVAISFSKIKNVKLLSRVRLFATPWTVAYQAPLSMEFSRQETGVGCHFLLQGILLTQGSNLGLLYCRQMLLPAEPPGKSQNKEGG